MLHFMAEAINRYLHTWSAEDQLDQLSHSRELVEPIGIEPMT